MISYQIILPKEGNKNDIRNFIFEKDTYLYPPISSIVNINEYSEKLFNNATLFIGEASAKIIGMCAGYLNIGSELSYISYLCVDKFYQNNSIGSNLLTNAFEYFKTHKSLGVWVSMYSENKKLLQFYKLHGFSILNEELFFDTNIKKLNLVKYF